MRQTSIRTYPCAQRGDAEEPRGSEGTPEGTGLDLGNPSIPALSACIPKSSLVTVGHLREIALGVWVVDMRALTSIS